MGFWCFMLAVSLLIPATMIGVGRWFRKGGPKDINALVGYRTRRSMRSQEAWRFAHRCCGRLWVPVGWALLVVSVGAMLPVLGRNADGVGLWGGILVGAQTLILCATILPVEAALKRTFDCKP